VLRTTIRQSAEPMLYLFVLCWLNHNEIFGFLLLGFVLSISSEAIVTRFKRGGSDEGGERTVEGSDNYELGDPCFDIIFDWMVVLNC
jgi:hypothetical protein